MSEEKIKYAERDIKYIFNQMIKLFKSRDDLPDMTFFFNKDMLACGFVRKGETSESEYQTNIQNTGKTLKPTITVMVSNGQMTIAHHMSKLTSIFVQENPETNKPWEGWEEIW